MEFEQEEQLAAFCVDHLFWQKQAQHTEIGEDCHLVWSVIRVGGEINPEPEQPPELISFLTAKTFLFFFMLTVQERDTECLI